MSDQPVIETTALTKNFGPRAAVDAITLSVPKGICFGFLGPNGAGKTTMIRMMLGLAEPSEGAITVRGYPIATQKREALASVGGIVEEPAFYPYMTGRQNLEAWAALLDDEAKARIPSLLERVKLEGRGDERVKQYSLGMKQRLALARALLSDPELLILDEPTNGLDPAGIAEFRMLVREMVEQEQRTVFISSHLLDEIEKMCDHVTIIDHGRVVNQGSVEQLIAGGESGVLVDTDDQQRSYELMMQMPNMQQIVMTPDQKLLVPMPPTREFAIEITKLLVGAGIGVVEVTKAAQSLEQRYLDITAGSTPSVQGPHAPVADAPPPPPPPA